MQKSAGGGAEILVVPEEMCRELVGRVVGGLLYCL